MHTKFRSENPNGRDNWKELGLENWIILEWILGN